MLRGLIHFIRKVPNLSVAETLEHAHHMFGDLAVLRFRTAANADGPDNLSIHKQRIAASHERNARIVGLNAHQRSTLDGCGSHIFRLALRYGRRVRFARHERDTQHQRIAVTTVDTRQTVPVGNGETDVDTNSLLFSRAAAHSLSHSSSDRISFSLIRAIQIVVVRIANNPAVNNRFIRSQFLSAAKLDKTLYDCNM